MNLSKRKKGQLDYSVEVNKDFTGGYNFIAWLIWLRSWFFIVFTGAIAFLIGFLIYELYLMAAIATGLSLGYVLLLRWEYKKLKKGIGT